MGLRGTVLARKARLLVVAALGAAEKRVRPVAHGGGKRRVSIDDERPRPFSVQTIFADLGEPQPPRGTNRRS
jgi:hypothetical protein